MENFLGEDAIQTMSRTEAVGQDAPTEDAMKK
jgi:hypothetical protein